MPQSHWRSNQRSGWENTISEKLGMIWFGTGQVMATIERSDKRKVEKWHQQDVRIYTLGLSPQVRLVTSDDKQSNRTNKTTTWNRNIRLVQRPSESFQRTTQFHPPRGISASLESTTIVQDILLITIRATKPKPKEIYARK